MKTNLVLLHGFCEDHRIWDKVVEDLNNDYSIFCLDLPGFGNNRKSNDSIQAMAEYVLTELDREGFDQFVVCGHSMGGYIALEMAKHQPNRLQGLGLIHSHAAADNEEKKQNRDKTINHLINYGMDDFLRQMANSLISEENARFEELKKEVLLYLDRNSVEGLTSALQAMRDRADNTQWLTKNNIPMLWLLGRRDSFIPLEDGLKQSSLCQRAMIEILDNTGHLGMLEETENVREIVVQFVEWCKMLDG